MKQNCTPENGYNGQFYVCPCVPNHFSHVQLFATHGPWPSRFLCPWDFPGKNTGVGWDALLQGVFLTQGLNPHLLCLLHCGFFTNEPLGKSNFMYTLAQFLKTGKKKTSRRGAFSAIFFRYCERTGWLGQQYLLGDLGNLEAVSRDLWGWVKDMWGAGGAPESEALAQHGLICPYFSRGIRRFSWTSAPILVPHGSFLEPSHPQTIVGRHS